MEKPIPIAPKVAATANRPMLVRAKPLEGENRTQQRRTASGSAVRGIRYLAVSREAGSGGDEIAQAVAKRLGWAFYDRSLLDDAAEQLQLMGTMLDPADEMPGDWGSAIFGKSKDHKIAPHEKGVPQLSQVVLEVSKRGNAVFVGRGTQFILPRPQVLVVRIVASEKYRILQIAAHTGVAESAAHQSIRAQDEGRRDFVQRSFHRDITDPHQHDLVINVDHCGPEGAVNLILAALGGQTAPPAK